MTQNVIRPPAILSDRHVVRGARLALGLRAMTRPRAIIASVLLAAGCQAPPHAETLDAGSAPVDAVIAAPDAQPQPYLVKDINLRPTYTGTAASVPGGLTAFHDVQLFVASDGFTLGLWSTDGTEAGTYRIKDTNLTAVPDGPDRVLHQLMAGDTLFFLLGTPWSGPQELWKSDGTEAGTERIQQFSADVFFVSELALAGDKVFFGIQRQRVIDQMYLSYEWELWAASLNDNTATRVVVTPGHLGSYSPIEGVGQWVYFSASTGTGGFGLWRSDGTAEGTTLVAPLGYENIADIVAIIDTTFFSVLSLGSPCQETCGLHVTDGTTEGTTRLVTSLSGWTCQLIPFGAAVVFEAYDEFGRLELWRSEGSEVSTSRFLQLDGFSLQRAVVVGNRMDLLLGAVDGAIELWTTDGTPDGTRCLLHIDRAQSLAMAVITGGRVIFSLYSDATEGSPKKKELWITDGSVEGTTFYAYAVLDGLDQLWPADGGHLVLFPGGALETGLELWAIPVL